MALTEHLEKLRHFKKVSQYSSIKSAALAIGISQAGLSKSIKSLEEILGVKLLSRTATGIQLTKEGWLLLESAERISLEADTVEIQIKSLRQVKVPQFFRIGMYDSIAVYFFETLQEYLSNAYPAVNLELVVDRSAKLFKQVENSEIDLCIAVGDESEIKNNLQVRKLYEDLFSFYINSKILDNYESKPFVIYPEASFKIQNGHVTTMQDFFRTKKANFHQVYNFETVKALTELRIGIGVMPNLVAAPLVRSKKLLLISIKNFPQFFGKHQILMAYKKTFEQKHSVFLSDLFRLAEDWTQK